MFTDRINFEWWCGNTFVDIGGYEIVDTTTIFNRICWYKVWMSVLKSKVETVYSIMIACKIKN